MTCFCVREIFSSKKINRLEFVLIALIYNTIRLYVINFEINLAFLIKPFSYMTKMSREKSKYLEKKKSFQDDIKSIFRNF